MSLGVLVIFCIAFDWARHSNLLMLLLVIAAARFVREGPRHQAVFAALLAVTWGLFELVPP